MRVFVMLPGVPPRRLAGATHWERSGGLPMVSDQDQRRGPGNLPRDPIRVGAGAESLSAVALARGRIPEACMDMAAEGCSPSASPWPPPGSKGCLTSCDLPL